MEYRVLAVTRKSRCAASWLPVRGHQNSWCAVMRSPGDRRVLIREVPPGWVGSR
jgi:hypothetical protein